MAACLAEARQGCAGEQPANSLRYSGMPPMTVGPRGLVRLDHLGGRLYATDATRWLACFEDCPGGGAERICFPLGLPLRLSWSASAGCDTTIRPAPPWREHPSQEVVLACEGSISRLRQVPALDPLRRDLVRAGVIEPSDALAGLEGLAVAMRAGDGPASELESLEPAGCGAFELPAGYRVISGARAQASLEEFGREPADKLAGEVELLRQTIAGEAVRRAKATLLPAFRDRYGDTCRAQGKDPAVDEELEACVARIPETGAPFREAVAGETSSLFAERQGELDRLTRDLLVGPICRRFAGVNAP